jgi:hypothetical protein
LNIYASDGTPIQTQDIAYSYTIEGSMTIDSGSVNSTGILLYLRNTGSITEILGSTYVDNVAISGVTYNGLSSFTLAPNEAIPVWIPGTAWADGVSHTVMIVANDGTPAEYNVHS